MRIFLLLALALGCAKAPADGAFVYYLAARGEDVDLYRVPAAGGGAELVRGGPDESYVYAVRAGALVLVEGRGGDYALLEAAADGSSARALSGPAEFTGRPELSPDGARLLFESSSESFRDLYVHTLADRRTARLTDAPGGSFDGTWSPDGASIAFASSRAGQLDLWIMDAKGRDPRRLTDHVGDAIRPAWRGDRIVYLSARDGEDALFSIRPDGRGLVNLTPNMPRVERFEVSPDGAEVAFSAGRAIHVVELATARVRTLSGAEHKDDEPAWSPDGRSLVFRSTARGRTDIWRMGSDGTDRVRLTDDGAAWLPRWFELSEGRRS